MSYQGLAGNAFDQLQKTNPTSPYVSALVADTRVQRRQYRSAFFFYNEALKQLPNLHGIHAALADVYRKTGHPDWAAAEDAKEAALPAADCKAHPAECEFLAGHDVQLTTLPRGAAPSPESAFLAGQGGQRVGAPGVLPARSVAAIGRAPSVTGRDRTRSGTTSRGGSGVASGARTLARQSAHRAGTSRLAVHGANDYRGRRFEQAETLLANDPRSAELNFVAGDSLLRLEEPEKAIPYLKRGADGRPQADGRGRLAGAGAVATRKERGGGPAPRAGAGAR